jgi:hypothetical protein
VRQRPGVVGQVPAHGGGEVARLGLQPLGPLALPGAPQRPVGLHGQRPVVVGEAARDLGRIGPVGQPLATNARMVSSIRRRRPRSVPSGSSCGTMAVAPAWRYP